MSNVSTFDSREFVLMHIPSKQLLNKFCEHHYLESINEATIKLTMPCYATWNPYPEHEFTETYTISEIKNEMKRRENDGEERGDYFKG